MAIKADKNLYTDMRAAIEPYLFIERLRGAVSSFLSFQLNKWFLSPRSDAAEYFRVTRREIS